jgi:hypothetical protein
MVLSKGKPKNLIIRDMYFLSNQTEDRKILKLFKIQLFDTWYGRENNFTKNPAPSVMKTKEEQQTLS